MKLLDFGIARAVESASERTQTGAMLGTPAYMSPEQALAKWSLVDSRSDLFSLGASMRSLLTGVSLHGATTGAEALVMAATRQAKPLLEICGNAPPAVAELIDRAVAFDKEDRFASAAEMRDAILRIERKDLPALLEPAEAERTAAAGEATHASATTRQPIGAEAASAAAQPKKVQPELSADGTLVSGSVARSVGSTSARRLGMAGAAALVLGGAALGWFALRDGPSASQQSSANLASDVEASSPLTSASSAVTSAQSTSAVVTPPSAAVPADSGVIPSAQSSQTTPSQAKSGGPVAPANSVTRDQVQSDALIRVGKLRSVAISFCKPPQAVNLRVFISNTGRWSSMQRPPFSAASSCVASVIAGSSSPPFSGSPIELNVSVGP